MPKISCQITSSGRIHLEKYTNGLGIDAIDFFEPSFFSGLKKMQKLRNSEKISMGNLEIAKEYGFDILDHITNVFPNEKSQAIFVLNANGYYAHGAFIENQFFILEVCDSSTDELVYHINDIE